MKPKPNGEPLEGGLDPEEFLAQLGEGRTVISYSAGGTIFAQGDVADAIYYLRRGKIKLSVVSSHGREAVIGLFRQGAFFGEGCLAGQGPRMSSAVAMSACTAVRIHKPAMVRLLHDQPVFAEYFLSHVVARTIRVEEDLVDQLFNCSEKRLARLLLLLADFDPDGVSEPVLAHISQETLAKMIGTTRSRVSYFMNKFRRLGFVDYRDGILVHRTLMKVIDGD